MQRLREARAHVDATGKPPQRDELSAAFRCVVHATARWADWPPSLHRCAADLFETCFRHGGIDASVARLSEAEARAAAGAIRRLVDGAESYCLPRRTR